MKRSLTLATVVLVLGATAQAQFNRGDRFFGGTFGANIGDFSNGPGRQVASNVGFAPSYSWFISKNLALGIRGGLQYSHIKNSNGVPSPVKDQVLGVFPGVSLTRYKTLRDKFGVYFAHDIAAGFNWRTFTSVTGKTKSNYRSAQYTFSPGVFYRFTENFLGQASVGGVYGSWSGANGDNNYTAGISFLQSFNLGIAYRISKRS